MIDLLIFSKDRACQAHLLLESIARYCPIDLFNISLLYAVSNDDYLKGYKLLSNRFPKVNFIRQTNFKQDVRQWLLDYSKNFMVAFAVDDDVFYRDIKDECEDLNRLQYNSVFSFRLGFNTIMQTHTKGVYQPPLNRYHSVKHYIGWNPSDYVRFNNYGYPMSVDLHVFNKEFMCECLKVIDYSHPNSLEGALTGFDQYVAVMISFKQSAVVNIPCNNMSGCTEVNSTVIECAELNNKYLNGKILDLSAISGYDIVGCHQDIPLTFKDFE